MDCLPVPMGHICAVLSSRLLRASELRASEEVGTCRAVHDLLELAMLGYPYASVRAIVHSIPRSRFGAIWLRRLVRQLRGIWPVRSVAHSCSRVHLYGGSRGP